MPLAVSLALGVLWPPGGAVHGAPADAPGTAHQEILFEAPGLRIYRTIARDGSGTLVLTNLDDDGNRLAPGEEPAACLATGAGSAVPAGAEEPRRPAPDRPAEARISIRVDVHGDEGGGGDESGAVTTVRDGEEGAPVVVVNVNTPSRARSEAAVPWAPVVIAPGGLPGPVRYPEHQYFLGYGPDISSPSLFGGLGLNAGNRFGLWSGIPCGRGFDCLFGPSREPR